MNCSRATSVWWTGPGPSAFSRLAITHADGTSAYIVDIHVTKHPRFGRSGNNLTVRVPVSFAEAAVGKIESGTTANGPYAEFNQAVIDRLPRFGLEIEDV